MAKPIFERAGGVPFREPSLHNVEAHTGPLSFLNVMSKFDPSAHIPLTNMAAYVGSTPKAPLDPGTVAFIKGKPAIVEPAVKTAKDWCYYENTIIHMHDLEGAVLKEYKDGGTWKEHYKSWRDACVPLGKSKRQIDSLIEAESTSRTECPTEPLSEKEQELDKVMALPTVDELLGRPTVHAGPAPKPEAHPAPKAVPEHQPRERNDNGKPVYALPVWKGLYEDYGHALNKIHDAHRAVPNPKRKERMVKATKDLMDEAESWKNEAKAR